MTHSLGIESALRIIEPNGWQICDLGLLDSAMDRPQAEMFGQEAHGSLDLKAAALLHSIVGNHCLVNGNKRLGWFCANVFLRLNADPCMLSDDDAVALVLACPGRRHDDRLQPETGGIAVRIVRCSARFADTSSARPGEAC